MNTEMAFEFVSVGGSIGAVWTLVRPFAGMTSHVAFEFRQFHRCIIAFGATMRLLVSVPVTNMTHQFTGSSECCIAEFALMWPDPSVGVHVVL